METKYDATDPQPVLKPGLYFGDNGRCFCDKHAGTSALYTGHDISGQRVSRVTDADLRAAKREGWTIRCEDCREEGGAA